MCAVAYFDPYVPLLLPFLPIVPYIVFVPSGNWAVDLQAGSEFGYKLLFIVLLSGLFAVILQVSFFLMSSPVTLTPFFSSSRVWHVNSEW